MFNRSWPQTAMVTVAILALLIPGTGASQQIPKEPIKFSLKAVLPDKPLKPGDKFSIELTAKIEDGWHFYSTEQEEGGPIPTRIVMPDDQPFELAGTIESPEPKVAMDPNFNLMTQSYEGQAVFTIPVRVAQTAVTGKAQVKVNVSFQTCSNELCLPPKTVKLAVDVTLTR